MHAVDAATRQGPLDLQDRGRDQVVAELPGRPRLHRVVRPASVRLVGRHRRAGLEVPNRRPGARDTRRSTRTPSTCPAATSTCGPSTRPPARSATPCPSAPTPGRRPPCGDGHAYVGTFGNEVLAIDLATRAVRWTYRHPTRSFPFYSSAAVTAGSRRRGRPRQARARPEPVERARPSGRSRRAPGSIVAARRREPRVRRVQRRRAVRTGPGVRARRSGSSPPARRCPPRRRPRRARSSSAPRMACCTVSAREMRA